MRAMCDVQSRTRCSHELYARATRSRDVSGASHLGLRFLSSVSSSGAAWAARSPILRNRRPASDSGSPVGSLPLGRPSRVAVSTRFAFCTRTAHLARWACLACQALCSAVVWWAVQRASERTNALKTCCGRTGQRQHCSCCLCSSVLETVTWPHSAHSEPPRGRREPRTTSVQLLQWALARRGAPGGSHNAASGRTTRRRRPAYPDPPC